MTRIPPGDLMHVKDTLAEVRAKGEKGCDALMARLMARHGNLTPEAKAFAADYAARHGKPA